MVLYLEVKTNRWRNKIDTPVISQYTYNVNKLGQRTSVATTGEAFDFTPADWMWGYNALGQLISANEDSYSYDQIGNRRTSRKGDDADTVYTANAPTYDTDGNQLNGLTPTESLFDRDTLSFTYNAENRPVKVAQNDDTLESYSYDHMGRRIHKGDTVTLYDGYNAIAEYKSNTRTLKTTYAWGNDLSGTVQGAGGVGGMLAVTEHDRQLPLTSYPCYDGNGNITEYLTEEGAGTLATHYEYDAFGNVIRKIGNKEYSYQFSTTPRDSLSRLNYYNYRHYDPVNGRWICRDEIEEEGGLNLYSMLGNDLVTCVDYLGHVKFLINLNTCTLHTRLTWNVEFRKDSSGGWTQKQKSFWKKKAQDQVETYFNKLKQSCKAKDKCCEKCKDGIKVKFDLSFVSKNADFNVVVYHTMEHQSFVIPSKGEAEFDNGDVFYKPPHYDQVPIVHETGHMLGLDHPGQNKPWLWRPSPNSPDDYMADPESLMGIGMEFRTRDFDKAFCSHINLGKPCEKWSGS
ncbi:hypothetical protein CXU22_03295 [Akkermansia muciniphila]|uniref:RHS repeat-associated core domain-containing protein n=1 Tax=Akkermansia muciniphila TaxID=239935 RepID=A0A2N8HF24_9BACT|nr:RHS repeat-associated core domain-containing protein [Akkermansia muciniphila]PNC18835.1 hypothetical protein CXU22_03295 [Akkermansia muciniphila]